MMFAPSVSTPKMPRSTPLRPRPEILACLLCWVLCGGFLTPEAAFAQEVSSRPDQVFRVNPRTGKVAKISGTILENNLEQVRVELEGKEQSYASSEVLRIIWGGVPAPYREAMVYLGRKDHENALALFRVAAGFDAARPVVRADARLKAAESLLAWGAADPLRYAECITEIDRFLADYPQSRDVPRVRWMKGRAQWLSGDTSSATATFRALYEQGASEPATTGYDRALCLEAGLAAARTSMAENDTRTARELFAALEIAFGQAASAAEDGSDARARLLAGQGEAAVGEGWCLLAGGQADQALRFFEARVARPELGFAGRYSARLGLAEAYLMGAELRLAMIEFAKVSALDPTSRDRNARALIGLADTKLKLGDSDAKAKARLWLEKVTEQFGDTPSAIRAAEMLAGL